MIYKHYGKLVRPKNAARYWQLKPSPPKEEKLVPIERTREELKEFLRTAQVAKMEPANCGTHYERRQAREKGERSRRGHSLTLILRITGWDEE
jgi:hypothetical protein